MKVFSTFNNRKSAAFEQTFYMVYIHVPETSISIYLHVYIDL